MTDRGLRRIRFPQMNETLKKGSFEIWNLLKLNMRWLETKIGAAKENTLCKNTLKNDLKLKTI